MRKVIIPLVLLLFAACTTTQPTASLEGAYLIHVECRKDLGVRQSVLFTLRQARPRDIKEDDNPAILVIEAAYYKSETAPDVLLCIEDDLRRMSMVTQVYIREHPLVIRQGP
jgi:hypothetical protein